jgi:hypothetical protein
MSATVQEIMNGNHLWNDGMTKGNTICPRPFHGGGIKISVYFYSLEKGNPLHLNNLESPPPRMIVPSLVKIGPVVLEKKSKM